MRVGFLIAATVLLATCLVSAKPIHYNGGNTLETANGIKFQFLGHSGKMKIFTNGSEDSFLTITMKKLTELEPDGGSAGHFVNSFASQDFTWEGPYDYDDHVEVNFTSALSVVGSAQDAQFTVRTAIYNRTTTVEAIPGEASSAFTVSKNEVKFSVYIQNWDFDSDQNTLQFGINVEHSGDDAPSTDHNNDNTVVSFGNNEIEFPHVVKADGTEQNLVNSTVEETGSSVELSWIFPHFSSSLYFDPTVSLNKSPAPTTLASALLLLLPTSLLFVL